MSAETQTRQQLRLDEVLGSGARQGAAVEVMTPENRLLFVGKIEAIQENALRIRDANDDILPMVMVNREVKLRFFTDEGNVVLYGKVFGSTMRMWKVDQLRTAFTKENRAFFRQSVSMEILAQCGKRPSKGGEPSVLFPCQVLDISAGGILISCKEPFSEGDRLLVTDVPLLAKEPTFQFDCVVRRGGAWSKGVAHYGCQFISISAREQERLLRAIFTIQRQEIQKRRESKRFSVLSEEE